MLKTLLLPLVAFVLSVGAIDAAAQGDAEAASAAASSLRQRFDRQQAALAADDVDGRYAMAYELYQSYDAKASDIEPLELAEQALTAATAIDPGHGESLVLLQLVTGQLQAAKQAADPDYWQMVFYVVGGLGIFLLGMKNMSDGVQAVAGNRLRRMINAVTDNRLMATGVGTGMTCLVQSSSITTVIVVGLVNSGLMLLHQAIGVIMGANIGTTITGWILVLNIGKYGLPIIGVSVFVYLFSNKDRWRYIALALMGLGLIFFGLELMKNGVHPFRDNPTFQEAFLWFKADNPMGVLKCVLVGSILTAIVQSSSATLAMTIAVASEGVIGFETAVALVLGQNIGTTITAWLASIGTTTVAKRAAYFHIAFNIVGVIIIVPLFGPYIDMIANVVAFLEGVDPRTLSIQAHPNFVVLIMFSIATAHTVFNVLMTAGNLPLVRYWAQALERFIPDKGVKEAPHLSSLDMRMVESPIIGIENSRGEIIKMSRGTVKMLDWTRELIAESKTDEQVVQKIFHREKIMDNVQQEVIEFLTTLLTAEAPYSVAVEGRQQLRIADEYESISDYVSNVLKAHLRLEQAHLQMSDEERAGVLALHDRVVEYLQMVTMAFEHNQEVLSRAQTQGDAVTHHVRELREAHLTRLTEAKVDPVASMSYTAMLNAYRKIKDHALNIAEAVGTKQS